MEEKLKDIFKNVNEWLKFAEAKNGVLLTLTGTALFTLLEKTSGMLFKNNISISNNIPEIKLDLNLFVSIYLILLMLFLALSMSILLMSFLPQTKPIFKVKDGKNQNDNILFYGHIIKYNAPEYLKFIEPSKTNFPKEELDYANQIIINSHITYRKYKYFELALFLIFSGVFTLIGAFLINKYFNPNK